MQVPQSAAANMKVVAKLMLLLALSGCAAMGALSLYSSWQGHPIEEFIAQVGRPTESGKRFFGSGNTYTWRGCYQTGRVVSYQQNIGGPFYSEAERACTACTAYTDERNTITAITGRCP